MLMTTDILQHDNDDVHGFNGAKAHLARQVKELGRQTAAELLLKDLPPVSYIVPGCIPEGLSILAGRPKLGKSWLSLGIAVAIATGGQALGSIPVKQGSVLYLALEDNERRLQRRLKQLLPESIRPEMLYIDTQCPSLDSGGIEAISDWVRTTKDAHLVIIDVFSKIRPQRNNSDTQYDADYRALSPLKQLADKAGIGVLIVHHVRKMGAEDPFDTVSGTTGFTGAADTVLILDSNGSGKTLYARGRDIEEIETAVSFERQTGAWIALGSASEVRRSDERQAILALLESAGGPMAPAQIADQLGVQSNNIRQLLSKMAKTGEVEKVGKGGYVCGAEAKAYTSRDNSDHVITEWDEAA